MNGEKPCPNGLVSQQLLVGGAERPPATHVSPGEATARYWVYQINRLLQGLFLSSFLSLSTNFYPNMRNTATTICRVHNCSFPVCTLDQNSPSVLHNKQFYQHSVYAHFLLLTGPPTPLFHRILMLHPQPLP